MTRLRGWPRRVVVAGESMSPAFAAGDRLLVVPVSDIEAGQIVAVRDPRDLRRVLVKRVRAAGPDGVDLRGDNEAASTDSRQFGPVPPANIVGRVVYRYFPPERSGWIGE